MIYIGLGAFTGTFLVSGNPIAAIIAAAAAVLAIKLDIFHMEEE